MKPVKPKSIRDLFVGDPVHNLGLWDLVRDNREIQSRRNTAEDHVFAALPGDDRSLHPIPYEVNPYLVIAPTVSNHFPTTLSKSIDLG